MTAPAGDQLGTGCRALAPGWHLIAHGSAARPGVSLRQKRFFPSSSLSRYGLVPRITREAATTTRGHAASREIGGTHDFGAGSCRAGVGKRAHYKTWAPAQREMRGSLVSLRESRLNA